MNCFLNLNRKTSYQLLLFLPIFGLSFISCKQNSKSDLITKINAIHHQLQIQEGINEEEELAMLSLCSLISRDGNFDDYLPIGRTPLKDVDNVPVFYGCENISPNEIKECFKKSISSFIKQEFNLNISKSLGLSKPKQIEAFFVIGKDGKVSGMKIRHSEIIVQAEVARVFKKIPSMKPGSKNGINVPVLCSVRITYGNEIEVEIVHFPDIPNKN